VDKEEQQAHEDVIVAMSLDLRAGIDGMTTERLDRHLAATAVIAKYRALYDGIDHPKWAMKYTPKHLKKWANKNPRKRPSVVQHGTVGAKWYVRARMHCAFVE
jgi:hypothetical protein